MPLHIVYLRLVFVHRFTYYVSQMYIRAFIILSFVRNLIVLHLYTLVIWKLKYKFIVIFLTVILFLDALASLDFTLVSE